MSRIIAGDLDPSEAYRRLQRRAGWVLGGALLGALLGGVLSVLTPPVYRATAVLAIGVDYGRSQWLDEDADRLVMGRVQELILSDQVLAEVLEGTAAGSSGGQDGPGSVAELRNGMRLVWVDNRWELSFVGQDPQQAASIANQWARVSIEQLGAAWEHAWRVAELQSLYFRVFCRPQSVAGESGGTLWVCDEGEPAGIPPDLPQALLVEIENSHGIIPALSFSWEARASPPSEPEGGHRTGRIIGGMLTGLLLGALAAATTRDRLG